uniref:Transcription initiation factor TFIID subunit 8 n=1 Tax=Kalmanozyma brasiliensis (strain GHG001) TaxID=1365824 RepID=V5E9G9_KALBG
MPAGSVPSWAVTSSSTALFGGGSSNATQAKRAGFDATTASALNEVSQLMKKFLTSVFSAATHAAELSCRGQQSARDLIYALETHGQPIRELRDFHRQQVREADEEDEKNKAGAQARSKASEHASAPATYKAKGRRAEKARQPADSEQDEEEDWTQGSNAFLPSDSDDGSEMDAWLVSSDSDDDHGNRRGAVHARVMKRKHDIARTLAKRQRRQDKLRPPVTGELGPSASTSSSARDLRALTSGEQAWRRVADHIVPRHLPGMPPRHAWMQTPAFPTNAYGSSFGGADDDDEETNKSKKDPLLLVNRKLANARLVEASLRRLIQNTDGAAALAYSASSTRNSDSSTTVEKDAPAKVNVPPAIASPAPAPSATTGGFAVPKTPASGLTLRLNRKISLPASAFNSPSQPSTPLGSRRPSIANFGNTSSVTAPGTPLGIGMSLGWGGEPLMSPLTPVSASVGGPITPYPPTPGGVYGHYFGSNPNAAVIPSRSRSQSIVAANAEPYSGGEGNAEQLGVRVPGPVNYKNVWYAPGSTIASGGLAGGATTSKTGNHPRSVKRMRKWKV